jgi:hypothetical protein
MRRVYIMLSGKLEENRPPGRTRGRWVDNVTAYRNKGVGDGVIGFNWLGIRPSGRPFFTLS